VATGGNCDQAIRETKSQKEGGKSVCKKADPRKDLYSKFNSLFTVNL
jgi:hypothetical protein